jgi:hypothetical protein
MAAWWTSYWRAFNVLVRGFGFFALVSGAALTAVGAIRLIQQGLVWSEEAPGLVLLAVGLLVSGLGAAILRAPAYRPDLGDVSWRFDPFGTLARTRTQAGSWWTGDR